MDTFAAFTGGARQARKDIDDLGPAWTIQRAQTLDGQFAAGYNKVVSDYLLESMS